MATIGFEVRFSVTQLMSVRLIRDLSQRLVDVLKCTQILNTQIHPTAQRLNVGDLGCKKLIPVSVITQNVHNLNALSVYTR